MSLSFSRRSRVRKRERVLKKGNKIEGKGRGKIGAWQKRKWRISDLPCDFMILFISHLISSFTPFLKWFSSSSFSLISYFLICLRLRFRFWLCHPYIVCRWQHSSFFFHFPFRLFLSFLTMLFFWGVFFLPFTIIAETSDDVIAGGLDDSAIDSPLSPPARPPLPSHIILFDVLVPLIEEWLTERGYMPATSFFHTHLPEGRVGRRVYIYRLQAQWRTRITKQGRARGGKNDGLIEMDRLIGRLLLPIWHDIGAP